MVFVYCGRNPSKESNVKVCIKFLYVKCYCNVFTSKVENTKIALFNIGGGSIKKKRLNFDVSVV